MLAGHIADVRPTGCEEIDRVMAIIKQGRSQFRGIRICENRKYYFNEMFEKDDSGIWFMRQRTITEPQKCLKLEHHVDFIDVQSIHHGEEFIGYVPTRGLEVSGGEGDSVYHVHPEQIGRIHLNHGKFAVFYPGDAHMPRLQVGDKSQEVCRLVFKIPVGKYDEFLNQVL